MDLAGGNVPLPRHAPDLQTETIIALSEFTFDLPIGRIRTAWNETMILQRGRLTDRKIEQYRKRGYYSAEYRSARRDRMKQKATKRSGNFVETEGRLIFTPA